MVLKVLIPEKKQDMLGWMLSLVMGQGLKVLNMKASLWVLVLRTKLLYVQCADNPGDGVRDCGVN